jgi:hypothetical protein
MFASNHSGAVLNLEELNLVLFSVICLLNRQYNRLCVHTLSAKVPNTNPFILEKPGRINQQ